VHARGSGAINASEPSRGKVVVVVERKRSRIEVGNGDGFILIGSKLA
jgi:hypothetical protein